MIASAKPKRKKASGALCDSETAVARRGGEGRSVNDGLVAAKINRIDEKDPVHGLPSVDPAAGDVPLANEASPSGRKSKGRSKPQVSPPPPLSDQSGNGGEIAVDSEVAYASICRQLQELQRRKAATLKSRMMIDNQLAALVTTEMGYHAGMEEAERKGLRAKAEQLIKAIDDGDELAPELNAVKSRVSAIVQTIRLSSNGFDKFLSDIEKEMIRLAKQLPAAKWIDDADRRSFGILSLATVIGETGDLSLYANPGKVWKRLGLAPYQGKMPSTWRSGKEGKLSAEQWTEIGYCPRRRSTMFVVGENIVKGNQIRERLTKEQKAEGEVGKVTWTGPYRQRYDEAKATAHTNHPDWSDGRCHSHGMLLATKRLIRDLWKEWNHA